MTPDTLREVAEQLVRRADQLADVLAPVHGAGGSAGWHGPAAERFRARIAVHHERLSAQADHIRGVARRLERRADVLEEEQRRLLLPTQLGTPSRAGVR